MTQERIIGLLRKEVTNSFSINSLLSRRITWTFPPFNSVMPVRLPIKCRKASSRSDNTESSLHSMNLVLVSDRFLHTFDTEVPESLGRRLSFLNT